MNLKEEHSNWIAFVGKFVAIQGNDHGRQRYYCKSILSFGLFLVPMLWKARIVRGAQTMKCLWHRVKTPYLWFLMSFTCVCCSPVSSFSFFLFSARPKFMWLHCHVICILFRWRILGRDNMRLRCQYKQSINWKMLARTFWSFTP